MTWVSKERYEEMPEDNQKGFVLCTSHNSQCEELGYDHYIFAPRVPEWAKPKVQPDVQEAC